VEGTQPPDTAPPQEPERVPESAPESAPSERAEDATAFPGDELDDAKDAATLGEVEAVAETDTSLPLEAIKEHITRLEGGPREKSYLDSSEKQHPTVGIGFNLDRDGAQSDIEKLGLDYKAVCDGTQTLTPEQIDTLFTNDVNDAIAGARRAVSNFDDLPAEKQVVVVDMVFNLGETKFKDFEDTIEAIDAGDWKTAAAEMTDSNWYSQTGNRAKADVKLMGGD
jgi:GH24 family phage-related lysozyme (muramidase)